MKQERHELRLGLLAIALASAGLAQAAVPTNPKSYSRVTQMTYDSVGRLATETVEPNQPDHCVKTTKTYTAMGKPLKVLTENCAGAPSTALFVSREVNHEYNAAGTYNFSIGPGQSSNTSVQLPAGMVLTKVTRGVGSSAQAVQSVYDPRFNAVSKTVAPNGLVKQDIYDTLGRVSRKYQPNGGYTTFRYCELDAANGSASSSDCPTTDLQSPPGAVRFTEEVAYAPNGTKISSESRIFTGLNGQQLRHLTRSFDGATQPAAFKGAWVAKDTYYFPTGEVSHVVGPFFLSNQSATTTTANDRQVLAYQYDQDGQLRRTFKSDANGNKVWLLQIGSNMVNVTGNVSEQFIRGTAKFGIDAAGRITASEIGAGGQVLRVTSPKGDQISYEFDAFLNRTKVIDPLGNISTTAHDFRGSAVNNYDPNSGSEVAKYNALGEVVSLQNARQIAAGTATTYTLDQFGRVSSKSEPEFTTSYSYDKYADGTSCGAATGLLCETSTSAGVRKRLMYDTLGRRIASRIDAMGQQSMLAQWSYDANGRPSTITYPSGLRVKYGYTATGAIQNLALDTATTGVALAAGSTLWTLNTVNADGKTVKSTFGNGVTDIKDYEGASGKTKSIIGKNSANTSIFSHAYTWDPVGNMLTRTDALGNGTYPVTDSFTYDELDRLTQYTVASSGMASPFSRTVALTYNAVGLPLTRSDVGTYSYGTNGQAKPYVPTSVGGSTFTSDATGNITGTSAGQTRSIQYTSFNLPDASFGLQGPSATPKYTWNYDEAYKRIRQTRVAGSSTRTTYYMGAADTGDAFFELDVISGQALPNGRHYLQTPVGIVGVATSAAPLPSLTASAMSQAGATVRLDKLEYWNKDFAGSISTATNHAGAVLARFAFDPFGKRRQLNGALDSTNSIQSAWSAYSATGTGRGFTGHEELDDVGIIHMNGRLYSDQYSLFLQADPKFGSGLDSQRYARYTYTNNNPLKYVDPDGYNPAAVAQGATGAAGAAGASTVNAGQNRQGGAGPGNAAYDSPWTNLNSAETGAQALARTADAVLSNVAAAVRRAADTIILVSNVFTQPLLNAIGLKDPTISEIALARIAADNGKKGDGDKKGFDLWLPNPTLRLWTRNSGTMSDHFRERFNISPPAPEEDFALRGRDYIGVPSNSRARANNSMPIVDRLSAELDDHLESIQQNKEANVARKLEDYKYKSWDKLFQSPTIVAQGYFSRDAAAKNSYGAGLEPTKIHITGEAASAMNVVTLTYHGTARSYSLEEFMKDDSVRLGYVKEAQGTPNQVDFLVLKVMTVQDLGKLINFIAK